MRVDSVHGYGYRGFRNSTINTSAVKQKYIPPKIQILTFTGNNMWQIASLTPENNGLGLPEASKGGEGAVGFELPESLNKYEKVEGKNVDTRSFMPIWNYNNARGGHKFLLHKGIKTENLEDVIEDKYFYSAMPGQTKEDVAKILNMSPEDIDYVIQSKPNAGKSKYCIIEPTEVKGIIKGASSSEFGATEEIPYQLMKISETNPKYNKLKNGKNYFIYTTELARTSQPYSYDAFGNGSFDAEIINSRGMKALAEIILNKMDTEEFGHYKPGTVLCHDRPSSTFMLHVANMSAQGNTNANGLKIHKIEHNPGRNYQGVTGNPFQMFSVVAKEGDEVILKTHPQSEILRKAFIHGIDSDKLTEAERITAKNIIEPYVAPFKDGAGTYNVTKIPIIGAKLNSENMSLGSVSHQFDKEMQSEETPDAAKFLTSDYASIKTKSVLNGSTPANLRLDDPNADFGRGNNGLSTHKSGFTTFKYNGENIDEIIAAREKNAVWFTDLIYKEYQKGQDALNKLFFNESQIKEGQKVIGYLKPMEKGDKLVMGWGRPDEQKGFNITLGGFKKFLERKDIPLEAKQKFRVIIGAGKWFEGAKDYKSIVRIIDEINQLDNGAYKGLVAYVDGFFPNRLVGCAQYGLFTSRREMCGITPLECKAAGVPYGATATGGPVDYTNPSNGYLTKEVVEGRPERYGLTWANTADEIDDARCNRQAEQVAEIFEKMYDDHTNNPEKYTAMCKKNIEEKIDWHENSEYNHGKTANKKYLEDIGETHKGYEARNKKTLKELQGKFGKAIEPLETLRQQIKFKPAKVILGALIVTLTLGSGAYLYMIHRKHKLQKQQQQKPLDKVA